MEKKNIIRERIFNNPLQNEEKLYGSDFPLHVLPSQLQEIVYATSERLNYPPDYIAMALCFVISTLTGNTHVAKLKEGWVEPAILYLALLGRPGTNKTHPLYFALRPLLDSDAVNVLKFKKEYKEYEKILSYSRKERDDRGIECIPDEPTLKKFVVSDITPESLAFLHENNKRGICLYSDELASWFKNFNRYNKGSEEQFWLSIFSGKPVILDRRGAKNSVSVKHSFINVIGTIQHGVLKDLAKGERAQNGFLDRILFVIPQNLEKRYWNEEELSIHVIPYWNSIIQRLINIDYITDETGDPIPRELSFKPDAKRMLYEWQRVNTDQCNQEKDEIMVGIYSKLEIYVIRFCLILQMARWLCGETDKDYIDLKSVEGAIEFVEYFKRTARKVQYIINSSDILEKLPMDKQKLYHALPREFSTSEGIKIATKFSISADSFKRMIGELKGELLENYKYGNYRKIF
ncbi:MAG: DUF3987 domain-containing protein [Dysgonomonas sp.]|nr:DUF3987 domain-containing protein [Dysgonomonas sp.]